MRDPEQISPATRDALVSLARIGMPHEICGFIRRDVLCDKPGAMVIHPMTNLAEATNRVEMDKDELITYYKRWYSHTVGVYHSHPGGQRHPSEIDCEYAPSGMRYFIITVDGVFEWNITDDGPKEITCHSPSMQSNSCSPKRTLPAASSLKLTETPTLGSRQLGVRNGRVTHPNADLTGQRGRH